MLLWSLQVIPIQKDFQHLVRQHTETHVLHQSLLLAKLTTIAKRLHRASYVTPQPSVRPTLVAKTSHRSLQVISSLPFTRIHVEHIPHCQWDKHPSPRLHAETLELHRWPQVYIYQQDFPCRYETYQLSKTLHDAACHPKSHRYPIATNCQPEVSTR